MPPFVPRKELRTPAALEKDDKPRHVVPTRPRRKPTLFDAVDRSAQKPGPSLEENQEYLRSRLSASEASDSTLSEIDSDEFEDVEQTVSRKRRKLNPSKSARERGGEDGGADGGDGGGDGDEDEADDDDDDNDINWEDAMAADPATLASNSNEPSGDLELTLGKTSQYSWTALPGQKKKGPSKIERRIRMQTHCMHVQFLLFHNLVRNAWACDKEVQRILVDQLGAGMHKEVERWRAACGNAGDAVQSTAKPAERPKRGRAARGAPDWSADAEKAEPGAPNLSQGDPLIRLLKHLAAYWKKRFRTTAPGLRKQGYKPLPVLEAELASYQRDEHDPATHGERIRNIAEFRELARNCEGSRDVGAVLFTALLRGLGLDARLVANLQPIGFGWSKSEDATPKSAGKRRDHAVKDGEEELQKSVHFQEADDGDSGDADATDDGDDEISLMEMPSPTVRGKKPATGLFDSDLPFPIYWTEVLSPISHRYIPVDPVVLHCVASNPELMSSFEPRGAKADKAKQVIGYVVGYSSDGTAKDVTIRYLKRHIWPGKTKGIRLPVEKVPVYDRAGKVKRYEEFDWFKSVMNSYARFQKKRSLADDLEDRHDLKPANVARETKAGGETLQGYKNSAEFVLERHLRREEALRHGAKHVKLFKTGKGEKATEEKVYMRKDVVPCKTVESWHKEGREVKAGEQPLKLVPVRAVTLTRKRELEIAEVEGGEKVKQGLYSRDQTAWIVPPPIRDGIIPKNSYGNIDCFVPSMVPAGAVHIPFRGTAKICRKLEINYAEAVTGFEFGAQRAVPVVEGVVVAAENERLVIDAWQADAAQKIKKEEDKKEKAVLALWKKFFTGLRIMQRVRNEYGEDETGIEESNPFTNKKKEGKRALPPSSHEDTTMNGLESMDAREDDGSVLEAALEDEPESRFFPPALEEDEIVGGGGFLVEDEQETRPLSPSPGPSKAKHDEESHLPKRFAGVEVLDTHVTPARRSKGKDRLRNDGGNSEVAPIPTPRRSVRQPSGADANIQDAQAQHLAPESSHSEKAELQGEPLDSAQHDAPRYETRRRSQRVAARKG